MAKSNNRRFRRLRRWWAGTACLLSLGPIAYAQERSPVLPVAPAVRLAAPVLFAEAVPISAKTEETPTAFAIGLGSPLLTAPAVPEAIPAAATIDLGVDRPAPQGRTQSPGPRMDQSSEDQPILVTIKIDAPGPSELFRLESEADWRERMRRDARQNYPFNRLEFPEGRRPATLENAIDRRWPLRVEFVEPNYLCYRRLFFQDINTERYGWDFGVLQPIASAGSFAWNLGLFPLRLLQTPVRNYECNVGYCLPGDPAPYMLYPPLR